MLLGSLDLKYNLKGIHLWRIDQMTVTVEFDVDMTQQNRIVFSKSFHDFVVYILGMLG